MKHDSKTGFLAEDSDRAAIYASINMLSIT